MAKIHTEPHVPCARFGFRLRLSLRLRLSAVAVWVLVGVGGELTREFKRPFLKKNLQDFFHTKKGVETPSLIKLLILK